MHPELFHNLINDFANDLEVQQVFAANVHHKNLSCIYLVQNLFIQVKSIRLIMLNKPRLRRWKDAGEHADESGTAGADIQIITKCEQDYYQ